MLTGVARRWGRGLITVCLIDTLLVHFSVPEDCFTMLKWEGNRSRQLHSSTVLNSNLLEDFIPISTERNVFLFSTPKSFASNVDVKPWNPSPSLLCSMLGKHWDSTTDWKVEWPLSVFMISRVGHHILSWVSAIFLLGFPCLSEVVLLLLGNL